MNKEYKRIGGGVIMVPQEIEDKFFGGDNSIGGKVLIETGDYQPYLTSFELQKKLFLDSYGCLTFSALRLLQIECNIRILNGDKLLFDVLDSLGCIDENGFPNFSDRFTVKASGTIPYRGNSQRNVFSSMRKDGLVGEKFYQFTDEMRQEEYFQTIPEDVIERGEKFLELFEISYEWIGNLFNRADLSEALKYSPVQVIVDSRITFKNGLIQAKSRYNYNHAELLIFEKPGGYRLTWNSYLNSLKKYAWDYDLACPARASIEMKKGIESVKKLKEKYEGKFVMGKQPGIYLIEKGVKRPFTNWFDYLVYSGNEENFNKVDPILLDMVEEGKPMDLRESPYWPFLSSHYRMLKELSAPENIRRLEEILADKAAEDSSWTVKTNIDYQPPKSVFEAIINFLKKLFNI